VLLGTAVGVCVGTDVGVGSGVAVGDAIGVAVAGAAVAVAVGVLVAAGTPVAVASGVAVVVGSAVGEAVGCGLAPGTAVAVGTEVPATVVGVTVATAVAVASGVAVGVGGVPLRTSNRSNVTGFGPSMWATRRIARLPDPFSAIVACPADPDASLTVPMLAPPSRTSRDPPLPCTNHTLSAVAVASTLNVTSRPSSAVRWYLTPGPTPSVTDAQSNE
jgi:hypothetical protein